MFEGLGWIKGLFEGLEWAKGSVEGLGWVRGVGIGEGKIEGFKVEELRCRFAQRKLGRDQLYFGQIFILNFRFFFSHRHYCNY